MWHCGGLCSRRCFRVDGSLSIPISGWGDIYCRGMMMAGLWWEFLWFFWFWELWLFLHSQEGAAISARRRRSFDLVLHTGVFVVTAG